MKRRAASCIEIEADLMAAAIGEADARAEHRVAEHVAGCPPCRTEHAEYRAIERELGTIREAAVDVGGVAQSRERLEARLDDVRSRIVAYRVFDSPLGPVLLAHSEQGVVLLEYLHGRRDTGTARLRAAARDRDGRRMVGSPRCSTGISGRISTGGPSSSTGRSTSG